MDMTTDAGFSNCLFQCANAAEGAGAVLAPVCGSWVFMSLGYAFRACYIYKCIINN